MRSKILCSLAALGIAAPAAISHADTASFALKKGPAGWECTPAFRRDDTRPIEVSIRIQGQVPSAEAVKLTAAVALAAGSLLEGPLGKTDDPTGGVWAFSPETKETRAERATIKGTVDNLPVDCVATPPEPTPPPNGGTSGGALTQEDLAAAEWLASHGESLAAVRNIIAEENPSSPADRIVLLPHLPSGTRAPSYPSSISERDLAQVVLLVRNAASAPGSIAWNLVRCESVPPYRVDGDIPSLAQLRAKDLKVDEPGYRLVRIGNVLTCGASELRYSLGVASTATPPDGVEWKVPVRPVYQLGATAMMGYDRTNQSTFSARDGRIDEAIERVGPGLLVGATYFVKGIDYADMRWYNHLFNPFLVVSLAAPKDRFVVGNALTYRGGISLGLGIAFNRVPALANGFAPNQAFTGSGDVPQKKKWDRGFYIGIGLDQRLQEAFGKLRKSGTGGGTSPADVAKARQNAEQSKSAPGDDPKPEAGNEKKPGGDTTRRPRT